MILKMIKIRGFFCFDLSIFTREMFYRFEDDCSFFLGMGFSCYSRGDGPGLFGGHRWIWAVGFPLLAAGKRICSLLFLFAQRAPRRIVATVAQSETSVRFPTHPTFRNR
jgi:hypothetical protein